MNNTAPVTYFISSLSQPPFCLHHHFKKGFDPRRHSSQVSPLGSFFPLSPRLLFHLPLFMYRTVSSLPPRPPPPFFIHSLISSFFCLRAALVSVSVSSMTQFSLCVCVWSLCAVKFRQSFSCHYAQHNFVLFLFLCTV